MPGVRDKLPARRVPSSRRNISARRKGNVAKVSICIPAYQVGSHLGETLDSIMAQTYRDYRVEIAIDPPSRELLANIEPFLSDPRVHVVENPSRLGWDANTAALLARVNSPYFTILPHDDKLHPGFLAALVPIIEGRPDAVIAYCDTQRFGNNSEQVTLDLPPNGVFENRLLAFYLGGAEGTPWRGVARTSVIDRLGGFPVDGYGGFAVECEWVLGLLGLGPAIRLPRPLFLKRIHPPQVMCASRARVRQRPADELRAAMDRHRRHMLAPVARMQGDTPAGRLLPLAAQAAMVHRHVQQLRILSERQVHEARDLRSDLEQAVHPGATQALALLDRALFLHGRHSAQENIQPPSTRPAHISAK